MQSVNKQRGLSLIELMISVLIGGVLLAGYSKQFVAIEVNERILAREAMLSSEGHHLMAIMQKDIARAGYFHRDDLDKDNPFLYVDKAIVKSNDDSNCISYRYDKNKDGVLSGEYFGFRFKSNAIQRSKGSALDCSAIAGWESISDSANLVVLNLDFHIDEPAGHSGRVFIKIKLVLAHSSHTNSATEFNRTVLVRAMI